MGHNREKFGALLKSIIGNLKSIIGSGLGHVEKTSNYIWTLQCDKYLCGVLRAYRNIPHESTQDKLLFLLFRIDHHHPTEAAFMLYTLMDIVVVTDY